MNTETVNRPRGRPPVVKAAEVTTDEVEVPVATNKVFGHVGKFIVVNTRQIQGLRLNLEKIRQYAMQNETTIGVAWDNGTQTALQYGNEKDAQAMIAKLDDYCL